MLIDALASLCHNMPGFLQNLEIKLVGQVDPSVIHALTLAGLSSAVVLTGNVDRLDALRMAASSTILLLLLNQQPNAKGRIPGKLFEYLALKRPILVLGPPEADAALITTTANAGVALDYADKAGMIRVLAQYYQQYLEGMLAQPVDNDINRYDIRLLTGEIARLLDDIIAGQP